MSRRPPKPRKPRRDDLTPEEGAVWVCMIVLTAFLATTLAWVIAREVLTTAPGIPAPGNNAPLTTGATP